MKAQMFIVGLWIVASLLAGCGGNELVEDTRKCFSKDIVTVNVPVVYQDDLFSLESAQGSTTFEYKIRYVKRGNGPTLIYFTGGPGSTSIDKPIERFFPSDFNLLFVDPRGIGCNSINRTDDFTFEHSDMSQFYSSKQIVKDVVLSIQKLELDDKLMVFGVSYGTVPATLLAYYFEGLNRPVESLVLEGVAGKFFEEGEYLDNVNIQWNEVLMALPESVRQSLAQGVPFGLSQANWWNFVSTHLLNGHKSIVPKLSSLRPSASMTDRNSLRDQISRSVPLISMPDGSDVRQFHRFISCREIFPDEKSGTRFFADNRFHEPNESPLYCPLELRLDLYDSAEFPLEKTKVVYFQGEDDPATPLGHALYHFNSQSHADRTLYVFPSGGHNPLTSLIVRGKGSCHASIFASIFSDLEQLTSKILSCIGEVEIYD